MTNHRSRLRWGRWAAVLAAAALSMSVVACSPVPETDPPASSPQKIEEPTAGGAAGEIASEETAAPEPAPEPTAPQPCTALDVELVGISPDALVCESGQPFRLSGANAHLTDLGVVTMHDAALVNATVAFVPAPEAPITAILHVEDPYSYAAEPQLLAPSSDAACLGQGGECELNWNLPDSGYQDPLDGLAIPQLWIELSDGVNQVVIWVVRVDFTSR